MSWSHAVGEWQDRHRRQRCLRERETGLEGEAETQHNKVCAGLVVSCGYSSVTRQDIVRAVRRSVSDAYINLPIIQHSQNSLHTLPLPRPYHPSLSPPFDLFVLSALPPFLSDSFICPSFNRKTSWVSEFPLLHSRRPAFRTVRLVVSRPYGDVPPLYHLTQSRPPSRMYHKDQTLADVQSP